MRVLILADDCNPEWPSLPVVGYKLARAIAEYTNVVVATHIRNRQNIEKAGFGRAEVRYVNNEYIAKPMFKLGRWVRGGSTTAWTMAVAFAYPSYLAFEWEVWRSARQELRRGEFDIVHRITPMSPTLPSPLAKWSPTPFVLGPLNGGLRWPAAFRSELAREREWLSYVRDAYRVLPYRNSTYHKARVILAAFSHTMDDIPKYARSKAIDFPEVGVDPDLFKGPNDRRPHKRKNILFVGRFVPYKLPQLLLRAFADRPELRSHGLIMVGDGPERPAMEQLIRVHHLEDCVELAGWKTQSGVAALMRQADVFAFPSIRELGAGVVVEAMACGLACVVVDYGGPGSLINVDRGIKVPLGDQDQLRRDFGSALVRLVTDDQMISKLGAAARNYVMRNYTWDVKARKIIDIYKQLATGDRLSASAIRVLTHNLIQ